MEISLRHHYEDPCTILWMIQLQLGKILEALFTAEQGRGQALMDLMESQCSLTLEPLGSSVKKIGTIENILNCVSSQTIFVAVGTNEINFGVLQKGQNPDFVTQKVDARPYFKENAATTVMSLNKDAYSEIGVLQSIKCKTRSLDR